MKNTLNSDSTYRKRFLNLNNMKKNNRGIMNPIKSTNLTLDNNVLNNILNKLNNNTLEQIEFEYLKQITVKNQRALISYLNKETGIGLKKIKLVENNEIFEKLLNGINLFKKVNPTIKIEHIFDSLVVSKNNIREATFHNVIKISLRSGSFIKISTATSDSLEISVINVQENKLRNGEGTRLMNIVFDFCYSQLEFRPRFILECTGNLKSYGYKSSTGISGQTNFFRKFGFRVVNRKHYPHYVLMSSPESNINLNEEMYQLAA
jgi:hypothetical protein